MTTRFAEPVVVACCLFLLTGCTTWQPAAVSPRQVIEHERPESVRVTGMDSGPVQIQEPRIENDSIAYVSGTCTRISDRRTRYSCPMTTVFSLDEVTLLEVERPAHMRTLAVLAPVVSFVTMAFAFAAGFGT
jgi:hypothetical protein